MRVSRGVANLKYQKKSTSSCVDLTLNAASYLMVIPTKRETLIGLKSNYLSYRRDDRSLSSTCGMTVWVDILPLAISAFTTFMWIKQKVEQCRRYYRKYLINKPKSVDRIKTALIIMVILFDYVEIFMELLIHIEKRLFNSANFCSYKSITALVLGHKYTK